MSDFRRRITNLLGNKKSTRDKLLFTIGCSAIMWYMLSITLVGFDIVKSPDSEQQYSASKSDDDGELRDFLEFSITAISGTLATYLGMVLGISQRSATQGNISQITELQKVAAWMYFVSLIYAVGLWGWEYGEHRNTAPVIVTLGKSILGLFGGTLAVLLNTESNVVNPGDNVVNPGNNVVNPGD